MGFVCKCLVDRTLPMGPGQAKPKATIWDHPLMGSPPTGGVARVWCIVDWVAVEGRCCGRLIPHTETGLRTLVGKELELVREVERYSLDIVGLTSMHIIEFRLRMEFLEFCSNHGLPITNSMFKHKGIHKYTWYQCTLGCSLRIDHVLVSLYLQPYVLDGWVKRGAELPLGG